MTRDVDDANRQLREAGDLGRKCHELESKIVMISQEMERLQQNLQAKQEENARLDAIARNQGAEIEGWRKKYTDLEANSRHTIEVEVTQKYNIYER